MATISLYISGQTPV